MQNITNATPSSLQDESVSSSSSPRVQFVESRIHVDRFEEHNGDVVERRYSNLLIEMLPRHLSTLCSHCKDPNCQVSNPPPGFFSANQVAKHRYANDCWISANGYVYDLSRYVTKHPGGSKAILARAGGDASNDYEFHSRYGKRVWKALEVGQLAVCSNQACGSNQAGGGVKPDDTDCVVS